MVELGSEKVTWVLDQDSGIIFVRLMWRRSDLMDVDHVVVFDAAKKVVWDSAQDYGIQLRSGAFPIRWRRSLTSICY